MRTLLAHLWRILVALVDWRTWLRKWEGKPIVDVVFVSNLRHPQDRRRYLGSWNPPEGHFNGPRTWFATRFGHIAARTRALNVMATDLSFDPSANLGERKRVAACRAEAKEQFLRAAQWAALNGARVILLAAATKRLFGSQIGRLRTMFPNILFTIGDNGTAWLLCEDVSRALWKADLQPDKARVCVIGPTGFLGEAVVAHLHKLGYEVVGLCSSAEGVGRCSINAFASFAEVGKVDAVVACTHATSVCLDPTSVNLLRRPWRKLLVIDVAEPANLSGEAYRACQHLVVRMDAGNGYSPNLRYVLDAIGFLSHGMFGLSRGVEFGCYCESTVLAAELLAGNESIRNIDWFTVTPETMKLVGALFAKYDIEPPSPRSFGKLVTSFNLRLASEPLSPHVVPGGQRAAEKVA